MEQTDNHGPAGAIRVCIVEDDPMLREILGSLFACEKDLELAGSYANGESAATGLVNELPDVVLMDIGLPGMSGIECVRTVSPTMHHTQFLMFTMHDEDDRVFDALKAGANGYILKNSTPEQITEAIREVHRGGAPMSTAVARMVVEHFHPVQQRKDLGADKLTDREYDVLQLLAEGLQYKEIAHRMELSVGTIRQHIHRMYAKLHVHNRVEAVNRFFGR